MANWSFDPSQYQEKTFEIIPAGDYRARIFDVVERTFSSGNEGYEITLEVSGQTSKLWFYLVLDPSNVARTNQRIGEFFDSFGITNPAMGSGRQWIGAVGAIRVKHEQYNGNNTAKVAYCIAKNRQDKLPAWAGNSAAPAAQAFEPVEADDLPF